MERTPNDERFHVGVAVSPTPRSLDGEMSQISRRSLVGGSWGGGTTFFGTRVCHVTFFWEM